MFPSHDRTRILAETTEEADEVAKRIADRFPTIDSGNQVNALGLRDRKLNILYKDPQSGKTLIAEIGITPSSMHIAAEQSHKYYEPYREFLEKYKGQDVPLEVREQMINQENMMRYLFRKAETDIHPSWLSDDIAKKQIPYAQEFWQKPQKRQMRWQKESQIASQPLILATKSMHLVSGIEN